MGPAERELGTEKRIGRDMFKIVCPESLGELYELLSSSSLYIGNDSGVSHIAGLSGTPTIVLFGPTDPNIWKPLGENVSVITSKDGKMAGITVSEVADKIKLYIN